MYTHLKRRPDHGCILISGPQAETFLQGQLTCDVKNCPTLGGYCNTQGRLVSIFRLLKNTDSEQTEYYLECPLDIVESTLKTLKKYAVFSKVVLENISDKIEIQPPFDIENWKRQDILAKIPQLSSKTQGLFLAHHLNLPELGAVSFNKGCYLGQEIVARMHYKTQIKKHLAILDLDFKEADSQIILEAGDPIYSLSLQPTEPVGHIVTISDKLILASILDSALSTELRAHSPSGPYLTGRI